MIGAVIGPINRPESIVAGRYTRDGRLVIVGRSVPLSSAQSISLAAVLEAAGPQHPWPDTVISSRFGNGRDRVTLTKVQPTVVAEVSATPPGRPACGDTEFATWDWPAGPSWRHPYVRGSRCLVMAGGVADR